MAERSPIQRVQRAGGNRHLEVVPHARPGCAPHWREVSVAGDTLGSMLRGDVGGPPLDAGSVFKRRPRFFTHIPSLTQDFHVC